MNMTLFPASDLAAASTPIRPSLGRFCQELACAIRTWLTRPRSTIGQELARRGECLSWHPVRRCVYILPRSLH